MISIPRFIIGIMAVGLAVVLIVAVAGFIRFNFTDGGDVVMTPEPKEVVTSSETTPTAESPVLELEEQTRNIVAPLDQSAQRVTKKPFGIFIDQATSPVQPERFGGYHTGVDFEMFPSEAMTDVVVRAICSGEVLTKRQATGYGGVVVTSCVIDGKDVTVVYGHLRLSSITANVGELMVAGDDIGILGTGGSSETDGERKHLHLGIHRGSTPALLGYVSTLSALSDWIDPCFYVCQ